MHHFRNIIRALRLDTIHTEFYSWRSRREASGAQIDMVIDRSDNVINVCEVKYSKGDFLLTKTEYQKMVNRIGALSSEVRERKAIQPILITTFGLKPGEYADLFQRVLTMDDLFDA